MYFYHPKLNNNKISLIFGALVNNNNLWSCDVNVTCHMATRLTNNRNTS